MASADSLFLGAADLRQLLEVIRERAQIAMTQYALLARVFTNPHDPPGAPAYPTQAFVTLMHWSQQASAEGELRAMGTELGAAVQLHVDATRELGQLLARIAPAHRRATPSRTSARGAGGSGSSRFSMEAIRCGRAPRPERSTPSGSPATS
jgi:hypothetical protein